MKKTLNSRTPQKKKTAKKRKFNNTFIFSPFHHSNHKVKTAAKIKKNCVFKGILETHFIVISL